MGCDIHSFIEYYSDDKTKSNNTIVECFSTDELDYGRDYVLFGCLAGVRCAVTPLINPRGLPTTPELSWYVKRRLSLKIIENSDYESLISCKDYYSYTSEVISKAQYENLHCKSIYSFKNSDDDSIINPYYHTISWLTLDELISVRKIYLLENVKYWSELSGKKRKSLIEQIEKTPERDLLNYTFDSHDSLMLYSTIMCMDAIEKMSSDTKTRLVFWFDS